MAGIGDDIKEVLEELGSSVIIRRSNGSVFSEKVDHESYPTHSSEFIRQFFHTMVFTHDTSAVNGDIIDSHGEFFIVTNLDTAYFEDLPVDNTGAVYKCNVFGVIKRGVETTDPIDYIKRMVYSVATGNPSSLHALQYENKFGMESLFAEDTQLLLREKHVLILPIGYDVKIGDRWFPDYTDESEYYRITAIETRRLSNCPICALAEDTR